MLKCLKCLCYYNTAVSGTETAVQLNCGWSRPHSQKPMVLVLVPELVVMVLLPPPLLLLLLCSICYFLLMLVFLVVVAIIMISITY
jgi:hypothetical protein